MEGCWSSLIWGTVLTLVERYVENGRLLGPWVVIWIRGLPNSWNRTATSEESWLYFQQSAIILFSPQHLGWVWVTPSLLVNGCRWLVFRDKGPRVRSWDFTSVANLKNAFSCTFTLPRVLMAWWLCERKWSFLLYLDFRHNWRNRNSAQLKIVAGFWDKTRILGKVKHCETWPQSFTHSPPFF